MLGEDLGLKIDNEQMIVNLNLNISNLKLKSNRFMAFTPVLAGANGEHEVLQPIVVSGRRQHIVFELEGNRDYANGFEPRRYNWKAQSIEYAHTADYQPWMNEGKLVIIED